MSNEKATPTLKDYAQYLIGQPCRVKDARFKILGIRLHSKYGLGFQLETPGYWHKKTTWWAFDDGVIPLLITYDQLTNEQWRELFALSGIEEKIGQFSAFEWFRNNAISKIKGGYPHWTPEQTRLLLSFGVDIFNLIGQGLAERRETK